MNISTNEVHLWYARDEEINDNYLLVQYYNFLSKEERIQQRRFYLKKHRHQYLITRALLRSVLSLYVGTIAPNAWQFDLNKYNKPYIKNFPFPFALNFNLSHTEKMVVLAVTMNRDIGVDVEFLLRRNLDLDIAKKYFSKIESKNLFAVPIGQQKSHFFYLWTLKEAYIKACGKGLTIPLNSFYYSFPDPGNVQISFDHNLNDQARYWRIWQIKPNETHIIGLATHSIDIDEHYCISMREIVPLKSIKEVNYPIITQSQPRR